MRHHTWPALGLLVLFCSLGLADPKPGSFAAIVEARFSHWDRNRDGKLTADEVDHLVNNHEITGDEAAAVASLHVYLRDHGPMTRLDKEQLLQAASKKTAAERRDLANKSQHFAEHYEGFRHHIAKAPRELFVGDAPRVQGMSQGHLGDCYFVSTIGAAVNSNPTRLRGIFHPHPDGSCDLVFLSGHRTTVKKLTDAQLALGSSAGDQGVWLNVLEQGLGQMGIIAKKKRPDDLAIDTIGRGGDPGKVINLLSGRKSDTLELGGRHANDPATVVKLRTLLRGATAGRFLVGCGVGKPPSVPPGIVKDHAYAVLGYDPATDSAVVWNPWGNHFQPKGPPGLEHGYATDHGRFEVPLRDFVHIFGYVEYETTHPELHRKK